MNAPRSSSTFARTELPARGGFLSRGLSRGSGVHPNPYGAGNIGTPKSLSYGPSSSWVRYWHSESSGCLRPRASTGRSEQLPCPSYQISHGTSTEDPPGRAGFPVALPLPLLASAVGQRAATPSATPPATRGCLPRAYLEKRGLRQHQRGGGRLVAATTREGLRGTGECADGTMGFAVGISSAALALRGEPRYCSDSFESPELAPLRPGAATPVSSSFADSADPTAPSGRVARFDLTVSISRSRRFTFIKPVGVADRAREVPVAVAVALRTCCSGGTWSGRSRRQTASAGSRPGRDAAASASSSPASSIARGLDRRLPC